MNKINRVHIVGVGGIGTSSLARWFLSLGYKVSGSDMSRSSITKELKKEGVKIFSGHLSQNVKKGISLVVYSAALPQTNPEIKKAKELNIPVKSYSETLGDLSANYKTIAIAGSHGKSTTTAMLSLVLINAGFDPTVIIGTKLREFKNRNFRRGKSDCLIIEADEHNAAFLNYSPASLIITNIDAEHLDFYKNLSDVKNTFLKFISRIKPNGILVLNKDDKNLWSLKSKIKKTARSKKIKLLWYGIKKSRHPDALSCLRRSLKIIGDHNVSNALAVYTLAKTMGVKENDILTTLSRYQGSWRRFEYRGSLKIACPSKLRRRRGNRKLKIFDDYAHHPTEIVATLSGIALKWPKTGLICVFEPHQTKRLQALFKAFVGAFDAADALILLDVYKVAGRDRASIVAKSISSKDLAEAIQGKTNKLKTNKLKTIVYLPSSQKLLPTIKNIIRDSRFAIYNSWIVVMTGAGDVYKVTNKLLQ